MSALSKKLHWLGKQIATCDAKAQFATKGAAMITASRKLLPPRLRPYHCDVCDRWHLTSKSIATT